MRKIGHLFFFTGKIAFLSKNFVSKQPVRCYRKDLISSTVIVKLPAGLLQTVPRGSSHSITREKKAKIFFQREDSFVLKSLVLEFLGPKKTII